MANVSCPFTYIFKQSCRILMVGPQIVFMNIGRNYSSALYISGNQANKTFAYLLPHLDFDERFDNIETLQKNLTLRGMNIDIVKLKEKWDFYVKMVTDKYTLEDRNKELTNRIKTLMESGKLTFEQEQEMLKLQTQKRIMREDLKAMKDAIYNVDNDVIESLLKLPNELDLNTPFNEPMILKKIGSIPEVENKKSHIDIGTEKKLLEFKNPMCYYLSNDAVLFEHAVLTYVNKIFDENNMVKIIGTDFGRSILVEASGLNHEDPMAAFILENQDEIERDSPNRMHLIGGASLISFLAMHTKQLIEPKKFPLKYFSTGRQYTPFSQNVQDCGLITSCQASVAHAFIMVKDAKSEEYKMLFEELLKTVCALYDDLCDHYRIVARPASELQSSEEMRVSFEMWSPFLNKYIEIGYISTYGNYLSKRLQIAYQTPTGRDFPAIISGTVVSVPRLLACLLEQNPNKFVLPSKIIDITYFK